MAVDDSYTKSLLHFGGADGSTTFADESGKTWTAAGNAQIDTAITSPFGDNNGVALFDGTGDYIYSADSADWQLDGGSDSNAWTIDFWVRFNGDPGTGIVGLVQQMVDQNNKWVFVLSNNVLYFIQRIASTNTILISNAWNPATTTWYHVAIVKNGTTGYLMFIDGTQIGTTQTDTTPLSDLAGNLYVGAYTGDAGTVSYLNGQMKELRVSKGVARWTANFTPPTAEYAPAAISNGGFWWGF